MVHELKRRVSLNAQVVELFKIKKIQDISDIAGTLVIPPSSIKKVCDDLVLSGMLRIITNNGIIEYEATSKLLESSENMYALYEDVTLPLTQENACVCSVNGLCGDMKKEVPCDGSEANKKRCYKWL